MEYYRQSSTDTLHALDSTPDGLTQAQADARRKAACCAAARP